MLSVIAAQTGKTVDISTAKDMKIFKEEQYEILAEELRKSLAMDRIYEMMGLKNGSKHL